MYFPIVDQKIYEGDSCAILCDLADIQRFSSAPAQNGRNSPFFKRI